MAMNSDTIEGKWKQMKGKIKEQWGKLTDDDLDKINGRAENWEGVMQEKYGMGKEEAKREFDKLSH
jgi:uncharacterized protein YjbJ (UPF0337 family)